MKKIISLLMSFAMLASAALGTTSIVYADESPTSGKCGDNASWNYDLSTQTLTISGTGDMYDYGQVYNDETSEMERHETPWKSYSSKGDNTIKTVIIQNGITNIGKEAFYGCYYLKSVSIPNSVTKIGESAFFDCLKLSKINLPNSVTQIDSFAFHSTGLKEITIPSSVEKMGETDYLENVFEHCDDLENIFVDENNKYYSSQDGVLFNKDKTKLLCLPAVGRSEYSIPDTVKFLNSNVFDSFSKYDVLKKLTIPASVENILISSAPAFDEAIAEIVVDENNKNYSSQDGVLFNKDKTELIYYPGFKEDKEYSVPDTVKKISCISSTEYLSKIVLSKSVEKISGFRNRVVEFAVDDANPNYSVKDGVLFNKDQTELICYPGCKEDLTYRIPDTVKFVAFSAFSQPKNIKSLIVPNELKDKDGYRIIFNFFKLSDVYFTGSEAEWNDMNITVENYGNLNYHFNYVEESDHNYGDWIVIDEPDCFSERNGLKKRVCSRCECIEYITVPYEHDFSGNSQYCHNCGEENPNYVAPTPGGGSGSTDPTPTPTPGGGSTGGDSGSTGGGGGGAPAPEPEPEKPAEVPTVPSKPSTTTPATTATKPATVKATGTKSKTKALAVYWNKQSGVDGYQIQVATDKKFKKNKKTVTVQKQNASKKTVKNLKKNKKYYVRVRSYKIVNGKKVYGGWSKVKSVKTK